MKFPPAATVDPTSVLVLTLWRFLARCEVDDGALNQAAGLVDDSGSGHDGGVTCADGAAVVNVIVGCKLDGSLLELHSYAGSVSGLT